MSSIRQLHPENIDRIRQQLIAFLLKHGERRITRDAIKWLSHVTEYDLDREGTAILVAQDNKQLAGFFCAVDYGNEISFAVVRETNRSCGIGQRLIKEFVHRNKKFTCRVNADNYPSLRACLQAGLVVNSCWLSSNGQLILQLVTANLLDSERDRQVIMNEDASTGDNDPLLK